ncbi:Oidioi.mRNA.OKI2018_I69.chr2.g7385.t1.cds [Oikopleura dioica]|uniref:Oidioi.mRNA.OKI2018_I69.chr2.g7385.t1.cds n=1 Tax=Oikopleura dioica TaxID=34765 RepID=A0ABN7T8D4_OIKDI|nr:Oidioi.mRNA.OKI2018_I69.chr2.g7385.t1.cds [Oikopleura dioica]
MRSINNLIFILIYNRIDAAEICKAGEVRIGESCFECPAGFRCSDEKLLSCDLGEYQDKEGQEFCKQCPETAIDERVDLEEPSVACNECPPGYVNIKNECKPPDDSEKHSRVRREVTNCKSGFYLVTSAVSGENECVPCPEGKYCTGGNNAQSKNCAKIGDHTYSGHGMSTCPSCTNIVSLYGKICKSDKNNKLSEIRECPAGTKADANGSNTTNCSAKNYCPGNCKEISCPKGTYSKASASECSICRAGKYCSNGSERDCGTDEVSADGQSSCIPCPPGYACPNEKLQDAVRCLPGNFIQGTSCTPCPAGSYCPSPTAGRKNCPEGTFSQAGATSCSPALPGFEAKNANTESPTKCSAGQYSVDGKECIDCPKNNYCPAVNRPPIPCLPGFHTANTKSTSCDPCPAGSFCESGQDPVPCEDGFYSHKGAFTCTVCKPGYLCTTTSHDSPMSDPCPAGSYCPIIDEGDGAKPTRKTCPEGTFQPETGKSSFHDCQPCPPGYVCTTNALPTVKCPAGFYCPGVTISQSLIDELDDSSTNLQYNNNPNTLSINGMQYPCPPGTYNPDEGITHVSQCKICDAGKYCIEGFPATGGNVTPCPAGYHSSSGGLANPQQCDVCSRGKYCESGKGETNCPAGTYRAEEGAESKSDCIPLQPGTFSSSTGKIDDTGTICPKGSFCPPGSTEAIPCPVGTYGNATGLHYQHNCKPCEPGKYCPSTGLTDADQIQCSRGYYCPLGTIYEKQFPCEAGTYSDVGTECQRKAPDAFDWVNVISCNLECQICDAGSYCPAATESTQVTSLKCPSGHYCPEGTMSKFQFPCQNGTYNEFEGKYSPNDCIKCTEGHWCGEGTTNPTPCPDGRYYKNDTSLIGARNVDECDLCPGGKYCTTTGSSDCDPGTYSRPGQTSCKPCVAGSYCPTGTSEKAMLNDLICPAGKFCPEGSENALLDCEEGFYCPKGTDQQLKCFPGTYNTQRGKAEASDCVQCDAGYYCTEGMATSPISNASMLCDEGYYCPKDIVLNAFLTKYDLESGDVQQALNRKVGSWGPKQFPCPGGTYRDTKGAKDDKECTDCSATKYCPEGSPKELDCPDGYVCGAKTEVPIPCPKGTYHDTTATPSLSSIDECTDCTEGMYCDGEGLTAPRDKCDPGYICFTGSPISNPLDIYGSECSAGGYCEQGSSQLTPCPDGTFSNASRATTDKECVDCRPGLFCDPGGSAIIEPTGGCLPGYYCTEKSNTSTQNSCGPGTFCEELSSVESSCTFGTYNPSFNNDSCVACDEGSLCKSTSLSSPGPACPEGSFCPSPFKFINPNDHTDIILMNTSSSYPKLLPEIGSYTPVLCPPGTYGVSGDKKDETTCVRCPEGKACFHFGMTFSDIEDCEAGFMCGEGNIYRTPSEGDGDSMSSGPCEPGHYCPAGTTISGSTAPKKCQPGTFNPNKFGKALDDCLPCLAGMACTAEGLEWPDAECEAGYYCTAGASSAQQNKCTLGHYCPPGSNKEKECPVGYYQKELGQSTCTPCPAGKLCPTEGMDDPQPCIAGSYCLGTHCEPGSTCDLGKLKPGTRQLIRCGCEDNGKVCGNTNVACYEERVPTYCPIGYYGVGDILKSEGECTLCDAGKYCDEPGMTSTQQKSIGKGHFSTGGARVKYPVETIYPNGTFDYPDCLGSNTCGLCEKGYFCNQEGLTTATPSANKCPKFTFSNQPGYGEDNCIICPVGYDCNTEGISELTDDLLCEEHFTCTGGGASKNDCEAGKYCPRGSSEGLPCTPGYFCEGTSTGRQICPAGTFCEGGNDAPEQCPPGYNCPVAGTYQPLPCQPGYYQDQQGQIQCELCSATKYCPDTAMSQSSDDLPLCDPGYICTGGAKSPKQEPCEEGTYKDSSMDSCESCPDGKYCPNKGMSDLTEFDCLDGFVCNGIVNNESPRGDKQCTPGHYCEKGFEYECPSGTFRLTSGSSSIDYCVECTPGFICPNATVSPTIKCPPGFFCPLGTGENEEQPCTPGHFCPEASDREILCPKGTLCSFDEMAEPDACTPGDLCDQLGQTTRKDCPEGYKCPVPVCASTDAFDLEKFHQYTTLYACDDDIVPEFKIPCGKGYYNDQLNQEDCKLCPEGKYCPYINTITPEDCVAGFDCVGGCKMSTPRTESIDCVNPPNATSTATFKYLCPKGYYCEPGQPKKPCLAGTYNPMEGAVNSDWCLTCPTGSTCDEATGEVPTDGTVTCEDGKYCTDGKIEDCPKGFYCDYSTNPGRSEPYPCPEGTFNDKTGLSKVEECSECTAGYYCDRQAMTQAPETLSSPPKCQAGFYCPIGSKSRQDTICPVGSFCQEEVGAPSPCPPREYTSSKGQEACKGCPERFICPGGTAPIPCPAGEYCGAGVSSGAKCPAGTWSNVEKLAKESECMACPPGKICKTEGIDDENKLENCPAGYWCQHSVQVDPAGSNSNCNNGKFGKCAAGFMCPEGSSRPIPCSAGTYQENEGQESCEPCPAGEFCFEGAAVLETNTNYTQVKRGKCPVGYYCPSGTKSPYDYPCRKGTYADLSSPREDDSACKICDAGSFCGKEGLELPSGLCTPGFYCPEGSTEATAKKCGSGNYCPEGSKEPLPCPAGKYCPGVTMSDIPDNNVNDPIWDCWPGYYCLAGSKTPNPSTGKCKKGFYCPAGNDAPKPCDAGTYLDFDLAFSSAHCKPCKPGYLCSEAGLSQPYDECSEGFYCVDNIEIECEAGYYCPKNSGFPRLCESGTYSARAASSCKACDAGKYCDPFETGVVVPVSSPKECPPGYYCPSGTKFMYEYPCPAGKIRKTEGAASENDCDPCPAGSYCKDRGLSAPTGDCYKGYECPQGQIRPNPSDHKCPAGHYCGREGCGDGIGTPCPVPCPANTYNDMPGATMLESCQPCTKACSGTGNIQDGDACAAGQDCEFDPPVPCPKGYYCPENETYKVECPPGTFRNEVGGKELSDCTNCTAGTYCPDSAMENVLTEFCDDGYDCQTGAEVPKPSTMVCPIGVYCEGIGKAALCTNGETTVFTGADKCHTCPKGYDCVSGSEPVICPIGFYCETGTPAECPSGTVGKIVGLTNQSECSPCPSGKVCPGGSIENECPAGKYCRENASEPATNIEECPAGYECPLGTGEPKPCSAGFFSEGSATSCTICPEKFYCEGPKDKQPCPLGYVCPEGTEFGRQFACPKGSYSDEIISDIADCIACDEFHYCEFPGQDKPTGRCDDGYRCESGESSPTPEDKLCLPGHYCEAGEQLRCKAGFFCPREGMTPADLVVPADDNAVTPNFQCNEGYYCDEGTRVGNPGLISSDERCASGEDCGGPCEPGHYCPRGTEKATMQKCKKGTYYSKVGARNEQDCIPCLAGYTCDTDGLADPTLSSQCEPGFYCPGGNRDFSTIQVPCKEGHKCPGDGNIAPIACEAGYYQMDQEQDSCDQCDPGYYCPVKSVSPQEEECPDGFYCPAGTQHGEMNPCPIGTIGAGTKLETITDCAPCPAGKACPFQGYPSTNSDSLPLCAPGIVCPLGGNATHILDGEKCEVGHYCEAGTESHSNGTGSKLPIECPTGTYNDVEGAQLERHCKFCKAGSYCDSPGATQASKLCKPGFYCPMGSTQIDQIPCPEGHYCEGDGNAFPEPCPTRTFQTKKESVKCDDCTEGFYCNDKGLINVEGVCKAGYYCPTGSKYPTEKKCPAGAHCPAGSSNYTLCDPGSYAPVEGMDACIGCPPGFICDPKDVVLNFTDWRHAITHTTCILGHYCQANTTNEADAIRCPDGTYSEPSFLQPPDLASSYEKQVGLKSIDECTPCPAGFWCDGVIKTECNSIGDYCQFGARTNQPTGLNNTCGPDGGPPEIGGPCTVGNSCESNKTPYSCEPGFYQDEERQEKCKACPDGNYCPAESINPIPCESGYSCENDKRYPYLDPCPAGTFDDEINQQCQICPEGKYCDQRGLNQTQIDSMDCLVGFFCGGESEDRNPYVEGRTKDTPSRNAQCVPGEFCPNIGLGSPEACPEGEYCETDFLNATSGECAQGFACPNEGTEFIDGDHDVDSVVGNPCGPGVFCTNGTDDDGSPCPETTYNNGYGLREEKECTPCLEGFMCEPEGLDYPTTPCADGQFCVNGTVNSCPEGYACNSTSPFPLPCYGAYSSENSDPSQCGPCNSGETCMITSSEHGINLTCADFPTSLDEPDFEPCLLHDISDYEDEGFGVSNGQPCPKGSFCERGKIPTYCPPGTYNDVTGGSSRGDCKPTDEYHFSQTPGSEISTGDGVCADGFYCVEGSSDRTPQDPKEGNGGPCTPGFYCNSGIRTECPAGTYTNSAGAILESDCYPCDIGHFCKNGAITPCDDGKKCFTGIESDTRDCIEGRCEAPDKDFGPVINVPCNAGEYWKDDSCQICPAGSYCNLDRSSVATTEPCLPGSACPEGTAFEHTVNACKIGQYSQSGDEGLEVLDCVPCDPGHACTEPKQPELGPECLAGFYCNEGSKELAPYESQCETGHYCADEGMTAFDDPIKKQCPPGTFNNIKGASSLDECLPCPPGYVCESSGIDELSFDMRCPEGFYCPEYGTQSAADAIKCPIGYFCPTGSSTPRPCEPGTFGTERGAIDKCVDCEAGYYCNGTNYDPGFNDLTRDEQLNECPLYHYCEKKSAYPTTCKAGTYNHDKTGLKESEECDDCPPGVFCTAGRIADECLAGYVCKGKASNAQFEPCKNGFYCPAGSKEHLKCPTGLMIVGAGKSINECDLCPGGSYCDEAETPTVAKPCNPGHYCLYGRDDSDEQEECPLGTYNPFPGGVDLSSCLSCPPGSYCNETGIGNINQQKFACPEGFFCPGGQGGQPYPNDTDTLNEPIPCPLGTYGPLLSLRGLEAQDDCEPCPKGFYCPEPGMSDPSEEAEVQEFKCQPGTYCPEGSSQNYTCPAGFFCENASEKVACPAGTYCPPERPETEGNDTTRPEFGNEEPYDCPIGSYCPISVYPDPDNPDKNITIGCMRPIRCQNGYAGAIEPDKKTEEGSCTICPPGTNSVPDRSGCEVCRAGTICQEGATTDSPLPKNITLEESKAYLCPPGYYCPEGAIIPIGCPPGTYGKVEGLTDAISCSDCPENYFTHLSGQQACLSCGGQARQPTPGSSSCLCQGSGREFQPSDRQCVCKVGYAERIINQRKECIRQVYDICRPGTYRAPEGDCKTKLEFDEYCTNMCSPRGYNNDTFDKELGICNCADQRDLEEICNYQCRSKLNQVETSPIVFKCSNGTSKIMARVDGQDDPLEFDLSDTSLNIINSDSTLDRTVCEVDDVEQVIFFMSLTPPIGGKRLVTGSYEEDAGILVDILDPNRTKRSRRQSQTPDNGIDNPIICLEQGQMIFFEVDTDSYPVYDETSLLNTNEDFDFGGFRLASEMLSIMDSVARVFAFRFDNPGTYVFYIAQPCNDPGGECEVDKTQVFYITVNSDRTSCPQIGPFFPATSRYGTLIGARFADDIYIAPDWLYISVLIIIGSAILGCLVWLLYLFRKYGWTKWVMETTFYRWVNSLLDIDQFVSKGSARNDKEFVDDIKEDEDEIEAFDSNRFFDYGRVLHLEDFDTQKFTVCFWNKALDLFLV